ncbi:MAG: PAS domain S-box protein [Nitrospirota bacterium]|nr:PAS domain S-box protein [Nitrospirota bacterium]
MMNLAFTKRLSFRIALPVISAVAIAAVLMAIIAYLAIDRFDVERQQTRLSRLSQRAYTFCEAALDELERTGGTKNERLVRIAKVRAMAALEDFYRSAGLEGLIFDGQNVIPLSRGLTSAHHGDLMQRVRPGGPIERISLGGASYFATVETFSPWGWDIVLASSAREHAALVSSVGRYYFAGFLVLVAVLVAIFLALHSLIARPIDEIVHAVQNGGMPRYRGVAEFEYLSDQLRDAIQKRDVLLANIERSHFIYVHDITGHLTYLSASVKQILGYTTEEFSTHYTTYLTKHPANVMAVEHTDESIKGIQQPPYELEILHKDGTTRWLEVTEVPVKDHAGRVTGVEGIARDITDRKKIETELRDNRQLLASLMGSLPGMAYRRRDDGDWTMEFVSEGCHPLTGYRSGDLVGNLTVSYGSLIHPEDRGIVYRIMRDSIDQGRKYRITYRIFSAEGELKWVWEQGQAIMSDGTVQSLVGFITDITETRQLEEELLKVHKLESLGVLAGGIAHDFNNLLQAILGNVSLARLYVSAPDKLLERLAEAERATREASELSNRILTFSRGGDPIRSVSSILKPLHDAIQSISADPKAGIDIRADSVLDPVEIDDGQLRQVFQNILLNARESMPWGGSVHIEARNIRISDADGLPLRNGNYVAVSIQDEGGGIAADLLAKIFDPYFTTKDVGSVRGRGLGLTACYSIVRRHGGTITAASSAGKGATFTVYIPAMERQMESESTGTAIELPEQRS